MIVEAYGWKWDGGVALITFILALGWLLAINRLSHRYDWPSTLSRKIIHLGTGPLFVLCWPFFGEESYARYFAVSIPVALTLMFGVVGLGWLDQPRLITSSTRTGDPKELLRGPLYYGISFIICTIFFWRTSPVGIVALMTLCVGDGLADMLGRQWGSHKLPFSTDKSWIGSLSMLSGSVSASLLFLFLFNQLGYFHPSLAIGYTVAGVGAIALIATLVEAIPIPDIDNLTLTLTVAVLGSIWF